MMFGKRLLLPSLFLLMAVTSCTGDRQEARLTGFVNPFIGTGYHGHTFPGAAYPFGQIQLSPDNGTQGWDWCSGYHYSDSLISGFSHLHLSGTGIGDLADISFLPVTSEVKVIDGEKNRDFISRYAQRFLHSDESAEPGYYSVKLKNGVKTELTVTKRAALHRYTFPEGEEKKLIINLGFAINWDKPYSTLLNVPDSTMVTGMRLSRGWAADQHVYFAVKFSKPVKNAIITGADEEENSIGIFSFSDDEIIAKTAISSVSIENAIRNLDSSLPGWDFEKVRKDASDAWEAELSKIQITPVDSNQATIFYTALYHTMIAPSLFSDENGEFKGIKGDVQKATGYERYTVFSLWDTYRALHPLLTFIHKPRVNDMVKSMLDHYKQTGLLPIWELQGNETYCMVGNHSIPVISEAILKGIGDFDRNLAFEAMVKSSVFDRDGMGIYDSLGYMPADKIKQSVSKSLEIAIDDWSLATAAAKLDRLPESEFFRARSKRYAYYFDNSTGFMRGKLIDGSWTYPFDPIHSNHEGSDYTEGNGWQYLWLVPHDVYRLIDLLGGDKKFADKLDEMFNLKEGLSGEKASADITGLIGAYSHGNEPGHHTTFLFNYAGRPWRTQELNRQIQLEMYANSPEGLCGNEDCGQMSAWYVFSSLGFYPVNPCELRYQFGSPLVKEARIDLGSEKYFVIKAPKASAENKYIKEVRYNGKVLDRTYITWEEISEGGTLEFVMSDTPVK